MPDISGATGLSYTPVQGDVGRRLRYRERATGPGGTSDWVYSGWSEPVEAAVGLKTVVYLAAHNNNARTLGKSALQANWGVIDEVSASWYVANADGTLSQAYGGGVEDLTVVTEAAANGVAISATIINNYFGTGWSWTPISTMIADPTARANNIAALVALCNDKGFTGIDIDYEHAPANTTERAAFTNYVQELAAALHAQNFTLSVVVPGRSTIGATNTFDWHKISLVADQLRIMIYDYDYGVFGSQSPLSWWLDVVKFAVGQAVPSKLIFGAANYGYVWSNGVIDSDGDVWTNITAQVATHGGTITLEEASATKRAEWVDGGVTKVAYYDDSETVALKGALLAKTHNTAGVSVWRAGQEDPDFYQAITDRFADDTGTFTMTLQPAADTTLDAGSTAQDRSFGASIFIKASAARRGLMRFHLQGIPDGATVTSAVLNINKYGFLAPDPVGRTYRVSRVTEPNWSRSAENVSAVAGGGVTWAQRDKDAGLAWTTPGGDFTDTGAVDATVPVDGVWMTWDIGTIVEAARDAGGQLDLLIRDTVESGSAAQATLAALQHGTASLRPYLTVTYTLAEQFTPSAATTINWSGRVWDVKEGVGLGPQNNRWHRNSVLLGDQGSLKMKIRKNASNQWESAEVGSQAVTGYGTYVWKTTSTMIPSDLSTVVGLYTYTATHVENDPNGNEELDIEYAKWGAPGYGPGSFTTWTPVQDTHPDTGFPLTYDGPLTNTLVWAQDYAKLSVARTDNGTVLAEWEIWGKKVPDFSDAKMRINFWLMWDGVNPIPPTDGLDREITLSEATHTPLPGGWEKPYDILFDEIFHGLTNGAAWPSSAFTTFGSAGTVRDVVVSGDTSRGRLTLTGTTGNVYSIAQLGGGSYTDFDSFQTDVTFPDPIPGSPWAVLEARRDTEDLGNGYRLILQGGTTNQLRLVRLTDYVETTLGSAVAYTPAAGQTYSLRLQMIGSALKGKVWQAGTLEPSAWQIERTDSTYASGVLQVSALAPTGIPSPTELLWDNILVLGTAAVQGVLPAMPTYGGNPGFVTNNANGINWGNLNWERKESLVAPTNWANPGGPGTNGWSRDNVNQTVDGYLRFRVTPGAGGAPPVCSEIWCNKRDFNYGTYICVIEKVNIASMHKSLVIGGPFTFHDPRVGDDQANANNEIDFAETSAWGGQNAAVETGHVYWQKNTGFIKGVHNPSDSVTIYTHKMVWDVNAQGFPFAVCESYAGVGYNGKTPVKTTNLGPDTVGDTLPTPQPNCSFIFNHWVVGTGFDRMNAGAGNPEVIMRWFGYYPKGDTVPVF